ncbi:SAM-dependent methyltransferase [Rhodoligotrophos appendicifer]|uniref:class I SAM-dependent methyltransferase n=1 Tax=Rhodoligotrophos appendicifer TaxID=987056 RepID=UPI00118473F5|nr:class I SAM-dependent methyltransferase [Rhodoligotrophos appendicifer]
MTTDPLYEDPALVQFYDLENGWGPDHEFCHRLAAGANSVLDLGCGTGQLAALLGQGRRVVGVDPAEAMLAVARVRPGGEQVTWRCGDARTVRLGATFDLVVLTGHAFQVFLTWDDQLAALRTIAAHLAPQGRFIFDMRNPVAEAWRDWTPSASRRAVAHPSLGNMLAWNDVAHDALTGIVTYETHYEGAGRHFQSTSQICFVSHGELGRLLETAGLVAEAWLGDWSGTAFTPTSEEIIPLGRLR